MKDRHGASDLIGKKSLEFQDPIPRGTVVLASRSRGV